MAEGDIYSTERATPRYATLADLKPGTSAWRVAVAMGAHRFFNLVHDPEIAAAIGKAEPPPDDPKNQPKGAPPKAVPFDPWSVADFRSGFTPSVCPRRGRLPPSTASLARWSVPGSCCRLVGARDCRSWGSST